MARKTDPEIEAEIERCAAENAAFEAEADAYFKLSSQEKCATPDGRNRGEAVEKSISQSRTNNNRITALKWVLNNE